MGMGIRANEREWDCSCWKRSRRRRILAERNEVNEVERRRMTIAVAVAVSSASGSMRALRTSLIAFVFQKRPVVMEEDGQIAWTAFGGG